jgi:hypothetical protein
MTETIVRALIGGGLGALCALFGNIFVLPFVLKYNERRKVTHDHLPKVLSGMLADGSYVKFVYRFMMPVLFVVVGAIAAVKMGEPV